MKKLKLNKSAFAGGEVLTRLQLKKVMGGGGPGSAGGYYKCCNNRNCTSCGPSSFVPSTSIARCDGLAYVCPAEGGVIGT